MAKYFVVGVFFLAVVILVCSAAQEEQDISVR